MAEFDQKKINIKIFDPPLTGHQLLKYMDLKGVRIHSAEISDESSLLGEVNLETKLVGVLVSQKEIWADNINKGPNYDLLDRVIIKFLERTGTTIGTIEERLLKEFMLSSLSDRFPLFTIFLKSIPFIIDFEIDSDKFVFALPNKAGKGVFDVFEVDKKIGNNFSIKKKFSDRKVANIDSKRGGKIEIKIIEADSANDDDFIACLVLFAGSFKYYDEIATKIRHGTKGLSEGNFILRPPETELKSMIISSEAKPTKKGKEKLRPHKKEPEVPKKEKAPEVIMQEKIEALQQPRKKVKKAVEAVPTPKAVELAPIKKPIEKKAKATPPQKVIEAAPAKKPIEKHPKKAKVEEPARKILVEEPAETVEIEVPSVEPILGEPTEEVIAESPPTKLESEETIKSTKLREPFKKEITLKPLALEDSITKIEGVTEKVRILLENIGIEIVDDLLFVDPGVLAERVGHKDVTPLKIKEWQMAAEKRIKATQKKE